MSTSDTWPADVIKLPAVFAIWPTCAVPTAVDIFAIFPDAPPAATVSPTDNVADVVMDNNCLSLSNAVIVPEWDVRFSPAVNVPDMFVNIAWRNGVSAGAEEYVKPWLIISKDANLIEVESEDNSWQILMTC